MEDGICVVSYLMLFIFEFDNNFLLHLLQI